MSKATRWWFAGVLTMGVLLVAGAGRNPAQDKPAHEKHDGSALHDSLRDVINAGAKMFNENGDHAGCYRLYQGSLLSVRPFLSMDLQKKIDAGVTNAEKMPSYADRAFELRRVLDEVRASAKFGPKAEKKKEIGIEKKKEDVPEKKKEIGIEKKKEEVPEKKKETVPEKKKEIGIEKKKEEVPEKKKETVTEKKKETVTEKKKEVTTEKKSETSTDKGQVAGKVRYDGKAVAGGYFVTLIGEDGKKFSSAIQKDGSFKFATPIQTGTYRVAIEVIPGEAKKGAGIAARYQSEATSGLTIRIDAGKQQVELNLLK